MSATTEADVTQFFDGAISAFGDAMKAGAKTQDEVVKWWSGALSGNPLGEWPKRNKEIFDEAIPAARKQIQEWTKLVEQNYRRSLDLLKKAMDSDQVGTADGMREKTRKLWEESLSVVKENAEAMAQANVKMMEIWTEILRKNLENGQAAIKAAAVAK